MRQIGEIKLSYMSKALSLGVNIMVLDLDVAFLQNPLSLIEGFFENPYEQVRSQTDIGHVQERRKIYRNTSLYGTWFTSPRINFGLLVVKAHPLSVKAFKCGWRKYQKVDIVRQEKVAIDQNCLVGCMKWLRFRWQYNISIFSLGFPLDQDPIPRQPQEVLLLDKVEHRKEWNGISFELGGQLARQELRRAVAAHATCYEGATKLLVIKAINAFYSPSYYDPRRMVITKPLMFISKEDLLDEIKSLAYLAIHTNRSLLLPNIMIGNTLFFDSTTSHYILGIGTSKIDESKLALCLSYKSSFRRTCQSFKKALWSSIPDDFAKSPLYDNEHYWYALFHLEIDFNRRRPSFRTVSETESPLRVVEPGYYDQIETSFNLPTPEPSILKFDMRGAVDRGHGETMQLLLHEVRKFGSHSRIVIDLFDSSLSPIKRTGPADIMSWAKDSVGSWSRIGGAVVSSRIDRLNYLLLPKYEEDMAYHSALAKLTICKSFLKYVKTNRTCFDKC